MDDELNDFEQRIRNEFGPCEEDSAAAAIAALRDAVASEREACARIADAYDDTHNDGDEGRYGKGAAEEIAAAIRARAT